MTLTEEILAQIPGDALAQLRRTDGLWKSMQTGALTVPTVVQESDQLLEIVEWDVIISGGTLGILIGAALAQKGWRVALIERGVLRGRDQEWNISRKELKVFVELGLLTEAELESAIATEFNPVRISFSQESEIWVKDVLNVGIDPVYLLEILKLRFLETGGILIENTAFEQVTVHPNGVTVKAGNDFHGRLLLDAMGHFSPIVRQARRGKKPDAVCLVVGTCATGFPKNDSGDLITSFTPIQNQCQYFWEAFPARDGRTTYMFTYLNADRDRISIEEFFEEYLRLLPKYQNITLSQLHWKRALFGFFPCYRESPLNLSWNRILPVGDSSGSQSPLSFGGFGAMVRHLKRLSQGVHEALECEVLNHQALSLLQPYQPNLSVTWLFQRAMSVGRNQTVPPNQINQLLTTVFNEMAQSGDHILKPFLQDVVQFVPLTQTLLKTGVLHPGLILRILPQVGLTNLLDWMMHFANLALYAGLYPIGISLQSWIKRLSPTQQYFWNRQLEAWKYGSGRDYLED
ncbi:FAD-binding oxidoreductase [Myxacorys almedinensis A]|uniref:FAD-binding oxidoreductase n=2 Tax=Myxacorys TaxID=2056239 RepID=A0A8J7YWP5_9CYAN|nr:FAD-binding oxidoreductase [Myxacorys almedinensis A]